MTALAIIAIIIGTLALIYGGLLLFAAGQASTPHSAEESRGCVIALVGLVLIAGAVGVLW